jgi:hypothetical protein
MLRGNDSEKNLKLAAAITLRYSDAPRDLQCIVLAEKNDMKSEISTVSVAESEYLQYRI